MGSPWDVATVPTRHLRDVIGSGVCYLGPDQQVVVVVAREAGGTVVAVVARPAGVERVLVVTDQEELK